MPLLKSMATLLLAKLNILFKRSERSMATTLSANPNGCSTMLAAPWALCLCFTVASANTLSSLAQVFKNPSNSLLPSSPSASCRYGRPHWSLPCYCKPCYHLCLASTSQLPQDWFTIFHGEQVAWIPAHKARSLPLPVGLQGRRPRT